MNKKKEKLKGLAILVSIIVIGIAATIYDKYLQSLPKKYTVGAIDKIWKPLKGGAQASYVYSVNGMEYDGNVSNYGYEEVAKPGRIFIVDDTKVNRGIMLLDKPVPDSVVAPKDGWDEIPDFAK